MSSLTKKEICNHNLDGIVYHPCKECGYLDTSKCPYHEPYAKCFANCSHFKIVVSFRYNRDGDQDGEEPEPFCDIYPDCRFQVNDNESNT